MKTAELLSSCDIRPSAHRIAIMQWLSEHPVHPTVDEIWQALSPGMPTLSKTTVYNTLRLLVSHGAAQMLTIDERNACFDADLTPHPHFFCRVCGRVYDVPATMPCGTASPEMMCGHQVEEEQHYYRGICAACTHQKQ